MTPYKSGDVVLVPFPFTDLLTSKKRPALILVSITSKTFPQLYVVSMITSHLEGETLMGDYEIESWEEAHLLHPSKVRLAKLVSMENKIITKQLGTLSKKDQQRVKKEFQKIFSTWV